MPDPEQPRDPARLQLQAQPGHPFRLSGLRMAVQQARIFPPEPFYKGHRGSNVLTFLPHERRIYDKDVMAESAAHRQQQM